ncbi:MAG: hypothetical protein JW726_04440, partial [Anaerolineales bacterium]|nr:hypothetical protein [Anaerolineales bacterium]
HFEIAHEGDKATYINFTMGAESDLDPNLLPTDLSAYDAVHIIPLGEAGKQHAFLQACRARGACFLSAGTFLEDVRDRAEIVRANMDLADAFFMNEEEAVCLYGSLEKATTHPSKVLFITLGEQGALVVQGNHHTRLPAAPAQRLDPTGAGDTFCGATLAHLLAGEHPLMAALAANTLAAREIEQVGPAALFAPDTPTEIALDPRVRINQQQLEKVSALIRSLPEAAPTQFTGDDFPPVGHPTALDFFFAGTLQQFSFWETANGHYSHPLIASLDGKQLKGSSYQYRAYLRPLVADSSFYSPERQANLSQQELKTILQADDGSHPTPAFHLHLQQARQYGRDMLALGLTPRVVLQRARDSSTPLMTFLDLLDHIAGYKEDPLRKKANLLAMCLNQRPERFLPFGAGETVQPVIDYHCMRSALRIGLVEVLDPDLQRKLAARQIVTPEEEWAVRYAVYLMQQQVVQISGQPLGAVDWFFFGYMRSHCPEMSEPICRECAANAVCAHCTNLFQPVLRTTFY